MVGEVDTNEMVSELSDFFDEKIKKVAVEPRFKEPLYNERYSSLR